MPGAGGKRKAVPPGRGAEGRAMQRLPVIVVLMIILLLMILIVIIRNYYDTNDTTATTTATTTTTTSTSTTAAATTTLLLLLLLLSRPRSRAYTVSSRSSHDFDCDSSKTAAGACAHLYII